MGWFASVGVGLLSGIVGFVVAFLVSIAAIEWYRIPQREGAAAFFGMGISLLVFFLCIGLGIACARHSAASPSPSVLKAWGVASAIVVAVGLVTLVLLWLFADLPPKWQGRRLELAIELRYPAHVTPPSPQDPTGVYAGITSFPSGRSSSWGRMQVEDARTEDGHIVVPAVLEIDTSAPEKTLNVQLGQGHEMVFPLEFGAKPTEEDAQWSRWIEAPKSAGSGPSFQVRYRVQQEPPPAPVRTSEELEAEERAKIEAEYNALSTDAPLVAWFRFTRYGNTEERQRAAAVAMRARPNFQQDMTAVILGSDLEATTEALRAFPHFPEPPIELAATVARVGDDIAAELRAMHELAPDDSARSDAASNISRKFSAWMEAVRSLQGRGDLSFIPQLQEIAHLSRKQPIGHVISIDVLRVASYYLHTWAGIAPLLEDPPPR
jgi:hypothetical protein